MTSDLDTNTNTPPARSTIIFVNDALTTTKIWDPLISQLENDYNVVNFDIFQPATLTLDSLTSSLRKTIATAKSSSPKVHIVALSIGAVIALNILSSTPNFSRPASPKVTSFIGISFELAASAPHAESIAAVWAERFPLAQKWGMRITADKSISRWMDPSYRGSPLWNQVRQCVLDIPTESFIQIGNVIKELYTVKEDGRRGICIADTGILGRVKLPCLFLAGSRDGIAPEEMDEFVQMLGGEESRCWRVEGAGRLPWWEDAAKENFVMGIKSWIQQHDGGT